MDLACCFKINEQVTFLITPQAPHKSIYKVCVEFLKKVPWRYRREIRLDSPERRVAPWAWFWDTRPTSSWRPRSVRPSGCCPAPPRSTRSPVKSGLPRRRRCRVALCGMKVCPKKCLIETYNLVIVLCETRLLQQILSFKEHQILFWIANSQVLTGSFAYQ